MQGLFIRLCLLVIALFATLYTNAMPLQQTSSRPPTIVSLMTDLESISLEQAESGNTTMTISWHMIHITEAHRLGLEVYRANQWASVLGPTEGLPAVGSRSLTVLHALNFGPPTYRLTISAEDGSLIDQRIVTIPYTLSTDDPQPTIQFFGTNAFSVDADVVADGRARIALVWNIDHRLPTSNLIFEQVMLGGRAVSVELPRSTFWIPSSGEGVVVPVPPQGNDIATIRLRIIDVITGTIYDEAEVNVPVIDNPFAGDDGG